MNIIVLCENCIDENLMSTAKEMFGEELSQIFDANTCTKCKKNTPSVVLHLLESAVQAKDLKWWEKK